jgi:hypothetical protein
MQYYSLKIFRSARAHVVQHFITLVLGKLCHAKQWPTPTSPLTPVIISLLIAKRDEYPCHAKQWPTPTSLSKGYPTQLKLALCVPAWLELPLHAQ